jgi:dienelactone hydrolase
MTPNTGFKPTGSKQLPGWGAPPGRHGWFPCGVYHRKGTLYEYRPNQQMPGFKITRQERTMENQIVIDSPDGTFRAYISRPAKLPAPAVVVLQELFGVNADIRATCDELASQGFIAIAPDLFWRQEAGVDLDVTSEADWQHGLRLYAAFDRDAGAKDIMETVRAAVELPESTGKVALQGYCLGALMAFITATRYEVDAAVAYHGGDTEKLPRRGSKVWPTRDSCVFSLAATFAVPPCRRQPRCQKQTSVNLAAAAMALSIRPKKFGYDG